MSEETPKILPTHWEEKEGNIKYEISIQTSKEEPWLIRRLETHIIEYHNGNYVRDTLILEARKEDYYLERYKVRFNWSGTGIDNVLTLSFNDHSPETLRIFYYDEIADSVKERGVKETIEYIKNFIIDSISTLLANKICELTEYD